MKPIVMLKQFDYANDGLEVKYEPSICEKEFKALVDSIYSKFSIAENAVNKLRRAVIWGVYHREELKFSTNNQYQLSADLNPLEGGRVRTMDLIPDELLQSQQVERLVKQTLETFYGNADTYLQPYIVQMSAIRYSPTVLETCYPSPDHPHRDGFNNAIWVLNKTAGLIGGESRIFSSDGAPLYETTLAEGDGLFVKDDCYLHQVLPMMTNSREVGSAPVARDILIIRIDPAHR